MSTILESLDIDFDTMTGTCRNGVVWKGARKVINDHLKETTGFKGGWFVYILNDDGEKYHFKLFNSYYQSAKVFKALGI